jgi:hypothetical protein
VGEEQVTEEGGGTEAMTTPSIALLGSTVVAIALAIDSSLVAADETQADSERRSATVTAACLAIASGVLATLAWLNS